MLYLSKHRQQRTIGFHQLIWRLGEAAKMPFPIHPHMLRHACGFKLANDGHDTRALQHYLGHKNSSVSVRSARRVALRRGPASLTGSATSSITFAFSPSF